MKTKPRASRADRKTQNANASKATKAAAPEQPTSWRGWLPTWLLALLAVAVMAGATFAVFEFVILSKLPRAMLGTWKVTNIERDATGELQAMRGATMEFCRDGTMIGRFVKEGKEGRIDATVEVEGDILRTTTVNPFTNKAETGVQTIIKLTDTEFVTEDHKKTRITLQRVP